MTCSHFRPLAIPLATSFSVPIAVSSQKRPMATAAALPQNRFPYPSHPRPSPYQIFHLPTGASQKQVKARCEPLQPKGVITVRRLTFSSVLRKDYELVREHHPDSSYSRASDLPKRIRDERFSAIKDAYDVLAGKRPGDPSRWSGPDSGRDWEFRSELERRRHGRTSWGPQAYAYSQSHHGHQHSTSNNDPTRPEDRRRDNILICVAFTVRPNRFTRFSGVVHSWLLVVRHNQLSPCVFLVACGVRATS